MDDFLPPDVVDAALAEFEKATEPVTTDDEVEDVLLVTSRHDIFRDFRDPHSLRLRGVSFPWEMPNANTYDYYRSGTGWMVFLEADLRAVTVRIRHDNPIDEPSPTLLGRTFSIFSDRDPGHYGHLMKTIIEAIDRGGESPLWAIAMSEYLPSYIRVELEKPYDQETSQVFLTPFGFQLAGADLARVFEKMKISTSIYGRRS